jgi:hypothetical protein
MYSHKSIEQELKEAVNSIKNRKRSAAAKLLVHHYR